MKTQRVTQGGVNLPLIQKEENEWKKRRNDNDENDNDEWFIQNLTESR